VSRQPLEATKIPLLGAQVIEASAGTGKTYTITSLLVRLVTEGRLGIEQVLAVTFTNAAAAELAARIRQRVTSVRAALQAGEAGGDEIAAHLLASPEREEMMTRLEHAARDVDRAAVTTIHGFCARALSEYVLSAGTRPDTTLLGDDRGVVYDVVTDFWSRHIATLPSAEFRVLGGDGLHKALSQVARGTLSAPGVPLDAAPSSETNADALERCAEHYATARVRFFEEGASLRDLLLSDPGLKRTSYRKDLVEREFEKLDVYFRTDEIDPAGYPDRDVGRFTSSRVVEFKKDKHAPVRHPLLDVLEKHYTLCKTAVEAAKLRRQLLLHRLAAEIEQRLQSEHARLHTESFDGLLRSLARALEQPTSGPTLAAAIRRRFPALLIDEFQDTDPVQYRIFQQIYRTDAAGGAPGTALFFIGDPKQSIYRFRGADVTTYLAAAGHAAPGDAARAVWTLGVNFRSGPQLVAAQNAVFSMHAEPFGATGIQYQPVAAAPGREDRLFGPAEQALPSGQVLPGQVLPSGQVLPGLRIVRTGELSAVALVAAEVARLLSSGTEIEGRAISPKDIAVLTRSNAEAEAAQEALRRVGVPAVMHGDRSVFEAREAKELRRVLRAWLEPGRRALLHAALATRLIGRTASQLARLGSDGEAFERETEAVRRYATAWRHRGIAVALESLFADEDLIARTLGDIDGERRITNFRHVLELLHQAEVDRHLGMVGLLRFLETAIAAPTGHQMAAEARQVRLESDDDAVTLTTMHKSKGLEYGIVFLPQVGRAEFRRWGQAPPYARYHDPDRDGREFLHVGDDERAHKFSRREDREEALRLGYVGLTRARHQTIAFIDSDKGFSALAWFLHGAAVGEEGLGTDSWKQLTDESVEAAYRQLRERAAGAVSVETAESDWLSAPRYQRPLRAALELTPPLPVKAPVTVQRTSSFSAMTRARAPLSPAERVGKDVDRTKGDAAVLLEASPLVAEAIVMDGFPRGAGPGDALHGILEHLPFAGSSEETRQRVIADGLFRRGFDAVHVPVVERCVEAVLRAPLTPAGVRLIDLDPSECSRELEFSLPVRRTERELLSAAALEACLARHASPGSPDATFLARDYALGVGHLEFPEFSGFLRGYLDLVVWKQEQMFVVDYKSNHLGSHYADYAPPRLRSAMESHHYLLQGLLYAVATHRYAAARIAGYSYERHFGGVSYVFLRGVSPEVPESGTGVYFFKPSQELVHALSQLFSAKETP